MTSGGAGMCNGGMTRKWWAAVIALGVLLVPVGVVWMAYAITQTDTTTGGTDLSTSAWPIVAFFVAFIGGALITVGMLGWMFSWFSGEGDDRHLDTSPSETLAHAVPTTSVGWGSDAADEPPA
jgi:hypothetical protein